MRIIDAHLHIFKSPSQRTVELISSLGHENSVDHLRESYSQLDMVHGVVMGNGGLDVENYDYPIDLFHYCVGLDSQWMQSGAKDAAQLEERIERHLERESCCGVKLYPGYNRLHLNDELYAPLYRLAAKYDKPVAVHMGLTSMPNAHLKYCHPLMLDEVAADNPRTRFVMCHFGNPFLDAAAAVLAKNPNVFADLSGLIEGRLNWEDYREEQAGYLFLLKSWLSASNAWDRIMYGTDWPVVNLAEYIGLISAVVPQRHHEKVFFDNANSIYGLGLR